MKKTDEFVTYSEIINQPRALEEILSRLEELPVDPTQFDQVLLTGCGSSLFLSGWIAHAWNKHLGTRALAVPSSELIFHPRSYFRPGDRALLLAFSRSGETTETSRAARIAIDDMGMKVVSVNCYPGSTLDKIGHYRLLFPEVQEKSVVMTQAFSAIAGAFLYWSKLDEVRALPPLIEESLTKNEEEIEELSTIEFEQLIFLGSGAFAHLASEAMLKVKEMTGKPTEAWQSFEFRHGPRAILRPGSLVWLFGNREDKDHLLDLISEFQDLGAEVCITGNQLPKEALNQADRSFSFDWPLQYTETEALGMLHLAQLYAFFRAVRLGKNPDKPDKLTKVVKL
ncbi:MAG TPA: SIS domain-containing protein [Acidobacteriota bacterium]|nr:SIS domain-containing protein [Acidobacteriota bacterium]